MNTADAQAPSLSLVVDRQLAWCEGGSVRYLVAEVTAPPVLSREGREPARPLNVALVIDASGSMSGGPIEYARRAAQGIVESLSDADTLSIVSFASQAVVHVDAQRMDRAGKKAAAAAIEAIGPRDNTNLFEGWLKGAELAATVMDRQPGCQNRIVLLSDGHANAGILDPATIERHASQLQQRGLLTSAVGIGDGYSTVQLAALASAGGGRLHDAERPHEIIEVVVAELREMAAAVAENVAVTLKYPHHAMATSLNGFNVQPGPGSLTVALGSLIGGAKRSVVCRLSLPRSEPDTYCAFSARLTWRKPGEADELIEEPVAGMIQFARGRENSTQLRDNAVSLQVAEVWHAAIVRHVVDLNRRHAGNEALAVLRRELQFFEPYCADLPGASQLVDELRQMKRVVHQEWDERGRKEMELVSYRRSTMHAESRSQPRSEGLASYLPRDPKGQ